jgi:hypothetical protein
VGGRTAAAGGFPGRGAPALTALRDDDPRRDVDEQLGHPRCNGGELAGGTGVVGLDGTEVVKALMAVCGSSGRAAWCSGMSTPQRTGRLADRGGLERCSGRGAVGRDPAPAVSASAGPALALPSLSSSAACGIPLLSVSRAAKRRKPNARRPKRRP